ncbi:MAG: SET domain-containing protein-lysine N-methyltransferase [Gemmatimonadetes bacterium]|nr:SET domain-containing protein-lysine N-methyltransferase [Gemmatimonadota bacterium]
MPPRSAPAIAPFKIRRSAISGRGAFATRDIKKGERLIEYLGERITHKVADARYDDERMSRHHTFLFAVSRQTVIDASVGGNDARFINHSCDPNCEALIQGSRVFIDAIRPIAKGDELFYDYGYERDGTETAEDEARYVCHCGTKKCRGTILAPKKPKRPRPHHAVARHTKKHRD